MPRHDREQLRLSMTAAEWAKYERDERAMLESIPRADAAPPSPAAPETPPAGVHVDERGREPATGEYVSPAQHPDGCRCPVHPDTPQPPPTPSLAEAARPLAARADEMERVAGNMALPDTLELTVALGELRAIRAALAAEEARDKLRREAAEAWLALPALVRAYDPKILAEWAKMETSR